MLEVCEKLAQSFLTHHSAQLETVISQYIDQIERRLDIDGVSLFTPLLGDRSAGPERARQEYALAKYHGHDIMPGKRFLYR